MLCAAVLPFFRGNSLTNKILIEKTSNVKGKTAVIYHGPFATISSSIPSHLQNVQGAVQNLRHETLQNFEKLLFRVYEKLNYAPQHFAEFLRHHHARLSLAHCAPQLNNNRSAMIYELKALTDLNPSQLDYVSKQSPDLHLSGIYDRVEKKIVIYQHKHNFPLSLAANLKKERDAFATV